MKHLLLILSVFLSVLIYSNCISQENLEYNPDSIPPPKIIIGHDTITCCGYPITLLCDITGGQQPYKIHWTPDSMFINPNSPRPTTKPILGKTTFYITVIDYAGNMAKDSIAITCCTKPVLTLAQIDTCVPYRIKVRLNLSVSGGLPTYRFKWKPDSLLDSANIQSPITKPLTETTIFNVLVTDTMGNSSRDTITVCVKSQDPPIIIMSHDTMLNCAYNLNIITDIHGGTMPYHIDWTYDTIIHPGTYDSNCNCKIGLVKMHIKVTDYQGLTAEDSITVYCTEPNVKIALIDTCIPYGTSVKLNLSSFGGLPSIHFSWQPAAILDNAFIRSPITLPLTKTTTITVKVTDTVGNVARDTMTVCVNQQNTVTDYQDLIEQQLKCIPNPAFDKTSIEFETNEFGYSEVFISDMLGNVVRKVFETTEPGKFNIDVDLSSFSSGIYTCTLRTPTERVSKMFVVVK
jgi:hypothetical protein